MILREKKQKQKQTNKRKQPKFSCFCFSFLTIKHYIKEIKFGETFTETTIFIHEDKY